MQRAQLIALFEKTATDVAEREIAGIDESTVISALGIDSLGMLDLVGQLESQLGVHVADEQLVGLMTIGDLLDLIETKKENADVGREPEGRDADPDLRDHGAR
jgi:acyl carrier protein